MNALVHAGLHLLGSKGGHLPRLTKLFTPLVIKFNYLQYLVLNNQR